MDEQGEAFRGSGLRYLTGDGGTGKTFALNVTQERLHAKGIGCRASAATGIAATRLDNGSTMHRLFGLIPGDPTTSQSNIRAGSYKAELLKQTRVFVCDEIGMVHSAYLDEIDRFLRDLHDDWRAQRPFGGHILIVTGDIKQLLPVVRDESDPTAAAQVSFFRSKWYRHFNKTTLTRQMRQLNPEEQEYRDYTTSVGRGTNIIKDRNNVPWVRVPRNLATYDESELIEHVYPGDVLDGERLGCKIVSLAVN
jgi:hypothetical protein